LPIRGNQVAGVGTLHKGDWFCEALGSETHVKRTHGIGVMAGQTVAFPDSGRLGRFPHTGRHLLETDQALKNGSSATATLLTDDRPEERSDEGWFDPFERIVEI
jgi:hypothetical protein